MEQDTLTGLIIAKAIEVHRILGPGLLESVYEECLHYELTGEGKNCERQAALPIVYKDRELNCGFRIDLLVEKSVIVELKSCEKILPIHEAQLLTYMKLSRITKGLILNFNVPVLKNGIKRMML